MEVWKPIPSFPAYEASSLGRIKRVTPAKGATVGKVIKAFIVNGQHLGVRLALGPKQHKTKTVHSLVCEAFHGPCPEGMELSHLNGDPLDNRPENLAYETRKRNLGRKADHGTAPRGDGHPRRKLTADQVHAIRGRMGEDNVTLGQEFGVHPTHVQAIKARRFWSHLPEARPCL